MLEPLTLPRSETWSRPMRPLSLGMSIQSRRSVRLRALDGVKPVADWLSRSWLKPLKLSASHTPMKKDQGVRLAGAWASPPMGPVRMSHRRGL